VSAWLRSVRDHCLAPERVDAAIYGGRYRPLFEDLPPLRVDEHALHALGRPGGPCDLGVEFVDDTDSDVSAVWPFFGQFIAHDITADRSPLRHRAVGGPAIYNLRVPKANLEGVYGTGPVGSRVLPVGRPRVVAHAAGPARRRLRPRRHPGPDLPRGETRRWTCSPRGVEPNWRSIGTHAMPRSRRAF